MDRKQCTEKRSGIRFREQDKKEQTEMWEVQGENKPDREDGTIHTKHTIQEECTEDEHRGDGRFNIKRRIFRSCVENTRRKEA